MNETMTLMLTLLSGVLLGAIFFGGLWWTVQKVVSSQWSTLGFISSLILRMSIALAGFYFVARGSWERMLLCLLGFIMARLIVTRLTRAVEKPAYPAQEARHAS